MPSLELERGQHAKEGVAGFAPGLALAGFAGEVGGGFWLAAGLGDRRDVQHRVDTPVAAEVEPVLDGLVAALA